MRAASAGNHAQGVALAAAKLGITARTTRPAERPCPDRGRRRTTARRWSCTAPPVDEALAEAQRLRTRPVRCSSTRSMMLDIIAGQGTIGLENPGRAAHGGHGDLRAGAVACRPGLSVAVKAKAEQQGGTSGGIRVQAETPAAYPPSLAGERRS
ncbi:hypothetical protein QJS66_08460 [Kocuria rhizophila]|nr:hypothetical protein QJS66_08460 [Kocuria rhizophila]